MREWVGLTVDIQTERDWTDSADRTNDMTGAQLRAARGLLNWAVRDLEENAGVSSSTIRRLDEVNGCSRGPEAALRSFKEALERHGVEFLFPPVGAPRVRLATNQ